MSCRSSVTVTNPDRFDLRNGHRCSGAQVPGATVRIVNDSTHETHSTTTSASGAYIFPIVPTGEYMLEAEATGFKLEKRTGITLDVNQNARADFALQVGSVQEVVEVKGDSPLVDTMDVQLGETVDQQRIENLPLNGRNVYDLIALMPGAVNVTTAITGTNATNQMNVNGNRNSDNNFYLDGGQNTSQFRNGGNMSPNPDAIAEFHLITSNFDAEYGRQPGSVLNVVTRSGTNALSRYGLRVSAQRYRQRAQLLPDHHELRCTGTSSAAPSADRSAATRRSSLRPTRASARRPTRSSRTACWCRPWRSARATFRRSRPPNVPPIRTDQSPSPAASFPHRGSIPVAQAIIKTLVPLPNNAAELRTPIPNPRPPPTIRACCASTISSPRPTACREPLFIDRSNTTAAVWRQQQFAASQLGQRQRHLSPEQCRHQ